MNKYGIASKMICMIMCVCKYSMRMCYLFTLSIMAAWEVAGDYIYTTPGDQDTDYLMLTLSVAGYRWSQICLLKELHLQVYCGSWMKCFHRLPQFIAKDSERSDLSRITFVFETRCTAKCKLYFLAVRQNVINVFFPSYTCSNMHAYNWYNLACGGCISLQGYNKWNNDVVEVWTGSNSKQSYSYLIQKNSTTSFTWTFQRAEELDVVRHNHSSQC